MSAPTTALRDLAEARLLFTRPALRPLLSEAVLDHVQRRLPAPARSNGPAGPSGQWVAGVGGGNEDATTGFSDGELARLLAALRADAARIRDRIRAGEDLLRRYQAGPHTLGGAERALGQSLAIMAATGAARTPPGVPFNPLSAQRVEMAGHLFLTLRDLPPLLMLAAALTERNGETIKELPAQHRILEGRAVEVVVVKRRRGPRRWFETVTWELGAPGRELHTPGRVLPAAGAGVDRPQPGAVRLVAAVVRVAQRARRTAWRRRRPRRALRTVAEGHHDPPDRLGRGPAAATDGRPPPTPAGTGAGGPSPEPAARVLPLRVSFNRVKTSMEVRRTKRMGGHLPSTAKSNSMPVLFRHYLSGDPVIRAWADEVLGEALVDAEQAALHAHQQAMRAAGGGPRVLPGPVDATALAAQPGLDHRTAQQAADGALDSGWTACVDHEHHPATDAPRQVTLLDCFHCGNCLVTRDHLPRLLGPARRARRAAVCAR